MTPIDRRDFLRLAGLGGAVAASGLAGCATFGSGAGPRDFTFVQISDTHWGFSGAPNPEARTTLPRAIAAVNALAQQPDFVVFTGDLTHTTDDAAERRRRLLEFREIAGGLKVKKVIFMQGEHDASLDRGAAYQEIFGPLHFSFDHGGVHFVAIDNTSDPRGYVGTAQLAWLERDLAAGPRERPIVVLTHRPLYDLAPTWDWATPDGAAVMALLMQYPNVTVFYGHIHQEHHQRTGHIVHHAAQSLIFPLPAPLSAPRRAPVPWDPAAPGRGLGYRSVAASGGTGGKPLVLSEYDSHGKPLRTS